jgi:hypothetical protein
MELTLLGSTKFVTAAKDRHGILKGPKYAPWMSKQKNETLRTQKCAGQGWIVNSKAQCYGSTMAVMYVSLDLA